MKKDIDRNEEMNKFIDIRLFGILEDLVRDKLNNKFGDSIWKSVDIYVEGNEIIVRLYIVYNQKQEITDSKLQKQIEQCFEDYIIGYNDDVLEERVVQILLSTGKTVSTVESCTGGMLASTIINCEGVSSCFSEGVVTYSNEAKVKYADVSLETLNTVGAVSEDTARQMAEGIKKRSGSDIGLSTTGIAGPGGGTKDKPVGLVYIGIATPSETQVYKLNLQGTRTEIRRITVKTVLFNLLKILK